MAWGIEEREDKNDENNRDKSYRKKNETSTFHFEKTSSPQFLLCASEGVICSCLRTIVSLLTASRPMYGQLRSGRFQAEEVKVWPKSSQIFNTV